tara:strand:+ start:37949 stop:39109 length:1161 start_codon:yes stop_codon:yes gene_type:complete
MKVLHCCLAAFYIDNYGYQENILPKMHKIQGHEVAIVASTETYLENKSLGYVNPRNYINEDGVPVSRIPYVKFLPHFLVKKLRLYSGIHQVLSNFQPDIIFLHDTQFLSIHTIAFYARRNPKVIIYADGHTDFVNSARGWISKNILHKIIYRYCAKIIAPYTKCFYGTLPSRVNFINEVYDIPKTSIKLLELGADDSSFDIVKREIIRIEKRKELNLKENDFVIISGGKIDKRKNIHFLIEAMNSLLNFPIKLILFGAPDEEMRYLLSDIESKENILYLGWQTTSAVYDLLFASDLGFFPGTHSVLWEQSCGVGLPCVFKKWKNIQHVDLGGNCLFLDDVSVNSIRNAILQLYLDPESFLKMEKISQEKCITHFSYSEIARRAINQ